MQISVNIDSENKTKQDDCWALYVGYMAGLMGAGLLTGGGGAEKNEAKALT